MNTYLAATLGALPALPGLWSLTPIGALIGGVVFIGIWLTTGRLYTKGSHREIVQLHEERYQALKDILKRKDSTIDSLVEQNGELVKGGTVTADFLREADATRREVDDA